MMAKKSKSKNIHTMYFFLKDEPTKNQKFALDKIAKGWVSWPVYDENNSKVWKVHVWKPKSFKEKEITFLKLLLR